MSPPDSIGNGVELFDVKRAPGVYVKGVLTEKRREQSHGDVFVNVGSLR